VGFERSIRKFAWIKPVRETLLEMVDATSDANGGRGNRMSAFERAGPECAFRFWK